MIGKCKTAGGERGIVVARRGARPAARAVPRQIGIEILAESSGERALIAGRRGDMVERTVAALPVQRLAERLGL
jgi:hypothetical protein